MTASGDSDAGKGSSPAGRGGAGTYLEGEVGAFYLLSMLAGGGARGLPGVQLERVRFQAVDDGFSLDDLVLEGATPAGPTLMEIQSKRTISFSPGDPVFKDVCGQIARARTPAGMTEARHVLAVATQRTSFRISGPYQDVLEWARTTSSAASFFRRLNAKGVASPEMRQLVETFRTHVVEAGVTDDDETVWRLLARFQILEFDFASGAPLARTLALTLARAVLAPEDVGRAGSLWSALIEMSLAQGKAGGAYDLPTLRQTLTTKGFILAGEPQFAAARAKVAEMAGHALADIGSTVAGAHLSRLEIVAALDEARDGHRLVELRGDPGVGKSAFLKLAADRVRSQANVLVLDPIGTPEGGWSALALRLGVAGTARAFLSDLAWSGGGVLFIDGVEMFATAERRRTVNDVLREVAAIEGFSVVVTARADFAADGDAWLAEDAVALLGPAGRVDVRELSDADVEVLTAHDPQLRHLLAPGHPAAAIARNLYRLTRLLKTPAAAPIRTEAALAEHWWSTGSDAEPAQVRAAQRILAALADGVLAGRPTLHSVNDSAARAGLLASLTLREGKRDHLAFYHDVLKDWAVGLRLSEAPELIDAQNLIRPVPPSLARGLEIAARVLLERGSGQAWTDLLDRLSAPGAHGSWRRHALLAILRSEVSARLLERESARLLAKGATLLRELCAAVVAVETVPTTELLRDLGVDPEGFAAPPTTLRTASGPGGARLLSWCVAHAGEVPIQAVSAVLKLVRVQAFVTLGIPNLGQGAAGMLFDWLLQLDVRGAASSVPSDPGGRDVSVDRSGRMIEELRMLSLLMAGEAPDQAKAYLVAIAGERDTYKVKAIRPFSATLAKVAPEELAALIEASLIDRPRSPRALRGERREPFSHGDSDYMPASPAQPPFLNLLEAAPEIGVRLIRTLTAHLIAFDARDERSDDDLTLVFESGPRAFPRRDSYFWSRGRPAESSVPSGLMALEAWAQERLDAGEPAEQVVTNVLGPDGSCVAFLLIAVDLIISHWPGTRDAAVPFVSSPELLALDRGRFRDDEPERLQFDAQPEPAGRIRLKDLQARPSRGVPLEQLLPYYIGDDDASRQVRSRLTEAVDGLDPYESWSDYGDPRFMGVHALNVVTPANWVSEETVRRYRSPPAEARHLEGLGKDRGRDIQAMETEARISLATTDVARGSPELVRDAVVFADGALPDGSDTDVLMSRSTGLMKIALLIARDGDDDVLTAQEAWVRAAIDWALVEDSKRSPGSSSRLEFNRQALATCALIHLWRRFGNPADRDHLIAIAARKDGSGSAGFEAALEALTQVDPRLAKSVMRTVFATSRWRWNSYDEDEAIAEAFERGDAARRALAVETEIAWLEGGPEPNWPTLPEKQLSIRHPIRLRGASAGTSPKEDEDAAPVSEVETDPLHVNTDVIAEWLDIMVGANQAVIDAWLPEVVEAYARWTARANGHGLAAHVEIERAPSRWNGVFYRMATPVILEGPEAAFQALLRDLEGLPDRSFAIVAGLVLYRADVWYFNTVDHVVDRPVALRKALVGRTLATSLWNRALTPGGLSIGHDVGPLVATLLMNEHNPFTQTTSYLVPAIFDRIDPLLEPLHALLAGGPAPFVALCVTNTLSVQPRARHAEFLLTAVEAWLTRLPTDLAIWIELGIGRRIIDWLRAAAVEEPGLLGADHPLRERMDDVIGRFVALGVPEAHEMEMAMVGG